MLFEGFNQDGTFTCIDECSKCGNVNAKVINSRLDSSLALRIRQKECKTCGHRWNTVEITEDDFHSITDLVETRDLLTLRTTVAELKSQIIGMQDMVVKLTNAAISLDGQLTNRKRAYNLSVNSKES